MWKIKFSEESDCVAAHIDVGSALALGQTPHSSLVWPETVETFGGVEVEVILRDHVGKIQE